MTEPYSAEELADRLAIDDLLTRYAMAVDDGDWDALDTVFTPDATIDYTSAGGIRGSYPEVKAWLEKALAPFPVRQHLIGNKRVAIDGDRATVRAYFFNPMRLTLADGTSRSAPGGGYYNHRLIRTPEGWRSQELVEDEVWRDGLPGDLEIPE
ncbi:MAG TPA: nuclear transport factor 2 family protein [Acidimicrobiales bacterium]|nr:nuclear transport factor 2 family protein [Acidimicrobiales bacterium]